MTRVRFIRAPRGDAVVPPPAVGPQSVLGASIRAAREDHTHEGVHRIVAGAGVAITPSSGLGDVTLEVLHWRPPVQLVTNLPPTGNQPGDARVVLSEAAIYVWTGATWQRVASGDGGGGGGGGGEGHDPTLTLEALMTNLRFADHLALPRYRLVRTVIDTFANASGIDDGLSEGYQHSDGRVGVGGWNEWNETLDFSAAPAGWMVRGNPVFDGRMRIVANGIQAIERDNPFPGQEITIEAKVQATAGTSIYSNLMNIEAAGVGWAVATVLPGEIMLRANTNTSHNIDMTTPRRVTLHFVPPHSHLYIDGVLTLQGGIGAATGLSRFQVGSNSSVAD